MFSSKSKIFPILNYRQTVHFGLVQQYYCLEESDLTQELPSLDNNLEQREKSPAFAQLGRTPCNVEMPSKPAFSFALQDESLSQPLPSLCPAVQALHVSEQRVPGLSPPSAFMKGQSLDEELVELKGKRRKQRSLGAVHVLSNSTAVTPQLLSLSPASNIKSAAAGKPVVD